VCSQLFCQIFYAFILVQCIAFGLAKLSILFFYRRIFFTKTFKIATSVMIGIVSIWSIGFFFAYVFRCGTHFWALWAPLMYLLEYCYDSKPFFYTLAISDVITDFIILSLPFFWVSRVLSASRSQTAICAITRKKLTD
jgi:hypothetical protein